MRYLFLFHFFASKLLFNTNLASLTQPLLFTSLSLFFFSLSPPLIYYLSLTLSSCLALASVCFTLSRQQLDKICLCLLTFCCYAALLCCSCCCCFFCCLLFLVFVLLLLPHCDCNLTLRQAAIGRRQSAARESFSAKRHVA